MGDLFFSLAGGKKSRKNRMPINKHDLPDKLPGEMVLKSARERHRRIRNVLEKELIFLSANLTAMQEIERHSQLIDETEAKDFFLITNLSLYEASILKITKLWWAPADENSCTLKHLSSFLSQNLKKKYKADLAQRREGLCRQIVKFERRIFPKILALRHKAIAHLDYELFIRGERIKSSAGRRYRKKELLLLSLAKKDLPLNILEDAFAFLSDYYSTLNFGFEPKQVPPSVKPIRGVDRVRKTNHIINALDAVLLTSEPVQLCQKDEKQWEDIYGQIFDEPAAVKNLIKQILARNFNKS